MPTSGELPSSAELLDRAVAATGLADFGSPSFLDGLEAFLASARDDAHLSPDGVTQVVDVIERRLCNRLEIEAWYHGHPEVEDEAPTEPVLITGLPRTGTTALAGVLSLDRRFRPLRAWETGRCCPPPTVEGEHEDPRRLAAIARLARPDSDAQQSVMLLREVDATNEDVEILGLEFRAQTCTMPVFGYHRWWRDSDMRDAYAYQRRVAKLLQSRRGPNRWLFKAPHYVFHLDAVLSAYPDARFLITHRDPVKTIPSWASLVTSRYPPGWGDHFRASDLGPHLVEHQVIGMRRLMETRARLGDERFHDVQHRTFADEPMLVLERIYAFLGLALPSALREEMAAWLQANAMGSRGVHRYAPEEYGLRATDLRKDFAFYTDRYGVTLEADV